MSAVGKSSTMPIFTERKWTSTIKNEPANAVEERERITHKHTLL